MRHPIKYLSHVQVVTEKNSNQSELCTVGTATSLFLLMRRKQFWMQPELTVRWTIRCQPKPAGPLHCGW